MKRSLSSGLAIKDRDTGRANPHRRKLHNFIDDGLKFVFPAKAGGITRGMPAAFAAPMLKGLLISGGEYIHIWQFAEGRDMGQSIEPLFKSVPEAVPKDERPTNILRLSMRSGSETSGRWALPVSGFLKGF
ncbi:hypothetical protein X759_28410 [Mesorhizobium sp. LSHC420B00]|uniref:hypothetical protein n=1 Tax=unclassified Mesorhizobium TaxID=325217 RepID=UPI0003CF8B4C|nr:hypothetical protein [Mesorhizobium sp. LSHC420B00]ESX65719.1 hypothetical protein X759_28410 [Mesorhizobium sp. LSHC420B00]